MFIKIFIAVIICFVLLIWLIDNFPILWDIIVFVVFCLYLAYLTCTFMQDANLSTIVKQGDCKLIVEIHEPILSTY